MPLDGDISLEYRLEVINRFLRRGDLTDSVVAIAKKTIFRLNVATKN